MVGERRSIRKFAHPFVLFLLTSFLLFSLTGVSPAIENEECLECHGMRDILEMSEEERLEMVIPTPGKKKVRKGKLTLFVDYERFRSSSHSELNCIDCHANISDLPHPQRMDMVDCAACHDEIMEEYKKSKHARVSKRLCYECHNPHTTISFRRLAQKERIEICLQCHKKEEGHTWLPQRELHFHYLECAVCHAPEAEKGLFFHLSTQGEEDRERVLLSYQQLKDFAGEYKGNVTKAIDPNENGLVEVQEITGFIAKLKEGGIRSPRLEEEVLVLKPYHNYTDEVEHLKDCTMCHTSGAPFYDHVMLRIPDEKGGWRTIKMDKAIMAKLPPILSKDYYFTTSHGKSGIECIDCHADLTILRDKEGSRVKKLGTPICEQCHEEIMAEYRDSLHAKVSKELCFGCHDPHSSVPFRELSVDQRKAICMKCHDPERSHDWLPQRGIHFRYLECTMCHAPQAEKGIVFFLQGVDKQGRKNRLDYREVAELLGMENPDLVSLVDSDGSGFLDDREVLSFLQLIRKKSRQTVEFGVNVLVLRSSHNYTDKGTKAKDCSLCHSSGAEFYSKVIMEIPEREGGVRTIPMDKSILVGISPIPVTSDFYLLGEGKISKRDIMELKDAIYKRLTPDFIYVVRKIGYKWLDVIGLLFIVGGLAFVGLHGLIRVLTIGMRRRRRQD